MYCHSHRFQEYNADIKTFTCPFTLQMHKLRSIHNASNIRIVKNFVLCVFNYESLLIIFIHGAIAICYIQNPVQFRFSKQVLYSVFRNEIL